MCHENPNQSPPWVLSPLASVLPWELFSSQPCNMVAYNLISFGVTYILYAIVKAKNMEDTLGLPHYALTLVFFLYQGTVFASYKTLFSFPFYKMHFSWEEAVEIPVALLGLIVIGYGFPYMTWKWLLSNRGTAEPSEEQPTVGQPARAKWHASRMTIVFSPQGQWTPPDIAKRFGFFFDDFTERAWYFRLILFVFFHVISLVAAIQATSGSAQCAIQTGLCAILCFTMSGVFAFLRPMRWTCLSFSWSITSLTQGVVFLVVAFAPQYSEILSFSFSVVCVFHCALWGSTIVQGYSIHDKEVPTIVKMCCLSGAYSIIGADMTAYTPLGVNVGPMREPDDEGQCYTGE